LPSTGKPRVAGQREVEQRGVAGVHA
jgi:hypothetical protein